MRKTLLFFYVLILCTSTLFAESPKEVIRQFVKSQNRAVTAYDIATHFDGLMTDPTYGPPNIFNAAGTATISVAALDATHFVVAYRDATMGTAIVGQVNGTTIQSYGSENVFSTVVTADISVSVLDATHFVVAYQDQTANEGKAIVGEVSGTTIQSYGSENMFSAINVSSVSVAALDATHFVVAYEAASEGKAIVGEVSGTTIQSYGSENVFNPAGSSSISMVALDATHFVVAYRDEGNSNHGTAIVGLVSGTTIQSYGSENVFNAINTRNISMAALDATHFVIAYTDEGNSDHGTAIVGLVSGTTIQSYGSENVFNAAITDEEIEIAALDASSFVVIYYDGFFDNFGGGCVSGPCTAQSIIGDITGTTITGYGNEVEMDNSQGDGDALNLSVANIGSFVVAYSDIASFEGTGIVASTAPLPIELVWFSAKQNEQQAELSWQTASEYNNKGFEIERRASNGEWENIGFVEGDVYAVTINNYTFIDSSPYAGINYYRLKQLDMDGQFEYSDIVSVNFHNGNIKSDLRIFPNPVSDGILNVDFPQENTEINFLKIYDGQGRLLIETAQNTTTLSVAHLPSGVYVLELRTENTVVRERFYKN